MGTLIELLAMLGFMAGVVVGELRDQAEVKRDARDLAEAEAWLTDLRSAFDEPVRRPLPGRSAA